jgi:osmotically-inducible protein OsmY
MNTRWRSKNLRINVLQAVLGYQPRAARNIVIDATPDGTVWLRGTAPSSADIQQINSIVSSLPGVKTVFCNIAVTPKS